MNAAFMLLAPGQRARETRPADHSSVLKAQKHQESPGCPAHDQLGRAALRENDMVAASMR
jgi:hypothetical protein